MATNEPSTIFCSECITAGRTDLAQVELTESACAASCDQMEGLEVMPLVLHPRTSLIIDRFSPFYSELGYKVTSIYHNTAHLLSIGHVEPQQLGKEARLTLISETGGIPLRLPIDAIIDVGDMLYLLSVFRSPGNSPLVTSFMYQDCSKFWLHVVATQTFVNGLLTYLSEPKSLGENPIKETMIIQLAPAHLYQFCMMFFREERY